MYVCILHGLLATSLLACMCVLDLCIYNGSELSVRGYAEFVPAAGYGGDGATGGRGPTGLPEKNAAAEVSGGTS